MDTFNRFIIVCLLSLVQNSFSFAAEGGLDQELLYTVKKNDTVWGICKTYVSDPLCWQKLVQYNKLKNPKYLPPKSIIRIPKTWLIDHPTTALVIAVEGDVLVVREASTAETVLAVGDLLNQQDVVKALNGSAMIKFADDSRLLLKANSTIRMASLQFYDPSQLVNTRIELLKGRVKAQVKKITNQNSSYQISTPAAVAAVRGTEFRVGRTQETKAAPVVMRTELLTGVLEVSAESNARTITAGQAVMAIEGEGVSEPVFLLPRPLMVLNQQQNFNLPFTFSWQLVPLAVVYKVTLMMGDVQIWEVETDKPEVLIEDIPYGEYQVLIRGIDVQGFEGRNRRLTLNYLLPDSP